jgi:Sulfotransferase family
MAETAASQTHARAHDDTGRPIGHPPPVLFVGGTGRSGTHVLAKLLSRHPRLAMIPIEVRFHVEDRGFPGLLAGHVSKEQFVRRLRGFWWKGFQTSRMRGLYRFVPAERFERAVTSFEASFDDDREAACRQLFYDLLWHWVGRSGADALVEQSCDTVAQAPTLVRLFPEAKFVHVVRDGRDASASRVAQTRGLVYPRTRRQGLEWWESRIRTIDAGARAIPPERLLTVSLDELLLLGQRRGLRQICRFAGLYTNRKMKQFFNRRMSPEMAHSERWRAGLGDRRAAKLERLYAEAVDRLEADGVGCALLLRRTLERSQAAEADRARPLPFLGGDGKQLGARI